MMITKEDDIIISRETWEELKNDDYFHELIEIIEDRESLREAKKMKPSHLPIMKNIEKQDWLD